MPPRFGGVVVPATLIVPLGTKDSEGRRPSENIRLTQQFFPPSGGNHVAGDDHLPDIFFPASSFKKFLILCNLCFHGLECVGLSV